MYFAQEDKNNIARACMVKVEEYYTYLETSGRLYLYRAIYDMYYRARTTRGQLYISGINGQYLNLDTADFRNLIQHLKSLATKSRSAFIPISTNTDYKSESQTRVARGILEYYLKDKKLDRLIDLATEYAIMYADSFIVLDWDVNKGRTVMMDEPKDDEGNPILDDNGKPTVITLKEGDLTAKCYTPIDMACDYSRRSPRDHEWYIARDWINKYEISAAYPELKNEIEALSDHVSFNNKDRLFVYNQRDSLNSDIVPVYTLYHNPTAAVPEGRMVRFLSPEILLFEGPLPIEDMQVKRMTPSEEGESAFGYSVSFDLLPICESLRKLYSTLITTETVSGIPILLMPENSNMDLTNLADGIKAMTYNAANGKPETLHLGQASQQTFELINLLKDLSQVISAINAVARGETPTNLSSGSSLALVLSTAIEYNSSLQRSYADLSEDIGTGLINILKTFAHTKRMMSIAGTSNKVAMKEWDKTDIDTINRVTVELGNPIQQTAGGRMKMAEDLLNKGVITDVKGYNEVMMTGRLDPLIEDSETELLYIRQENEELSNGNQVYAMVTDDQLEHIRRHKSVLYSKEAKEDEGIVTATLDHIQEHLDILGNPQYANLLASLGQAPMAPQPGEMPEGNPSDQVSMPSGDLPNMPSMPKNPMMEMSDGVNQE